MWALIVAHLKLYPALDKSLEGIDLDVVGQIVSIPSTQTRSTRFEFHIQTASRVGLDKPLQLPKKVRLNWYGNFPKLQLGEIWHLRIRLKRPWGFANPGSFDYEKWLFEHGIRATGYVRVKGLNQRIKEMSIRKVLGASLPNLIKVFSKQFIILIGVAFLIAAPLAYFALQNWLTSFAYHVSVGFTAFLIAGAATLILVLITVSYQAIKVAILNPSKTLRMD